MLNCEPHTELQPVYLVEPIYYRREFQVDDKGDFMTHRILYSSGTLEIMQPLHLSPSYTLKNMETQTQIYCKHFLGVRDLGGKYVCMYFVMVGFQFFCLFVLVIQVAMCLLLKQFKNTGI